MEIRNRTFSQPQSKLWTLKSGWGSQLTSRTRVKAPYEMGARARDERPWMGANSPVVCVCRCSAAQGASRAQWPARLVWLDARRAPRCVQPTTCAKGLDLGDRNS